jgi:hypothetical protein
VPTVAFCARCRGVPVHRHGALPAAAPRCLSKKNRGRPHDSHRSVSHGSGSFVCTTHAFFIPPVGRRRK